MSIEQKRFMTPALLEVVNGARRNAEERESDYIGTEHFLHALLEHENTTAFRVLDRLGIDIKKLKSEAEYLGPPRPAPWGTTRVRSGVAPLNKELPYTSKTKASYEEAIALAPEFNGVVGTGQLLLGMLIRNTIAAALMTQNGVQRDDVRTVLHEMQTLDGAAFSADSWT